MCHITLLFLCFISEPTSLVCAGALVGLLMTNLLHYTPVNVMLTLLNLSRCIDRISDRSHIMATVGESKSSDFP